MANKFLIHKERENPSKGAVPAIVCDMDHTLCHANNRNVYDYERVDTDVPDHETLDIVRTLLNGNDNLSLIILTGREDVGKCMEKTTGWLLRHGLNPDLVLMRAKGDHRHSNIVKKELIETHVLPNFYVKFIFEDSKRCADTYKEMGLKVIMPEISA